MKFTARLQKLEKRLNKNSKLWALFIIRYYDNDMDRKKAQTVIIADYLSEGNPEPDYKVFIQDAGSALKEGFLRFFWSD